MNFAEFKARRRWHEDLSAVILRPETVGERGFGYPGDLYIIFDPDAAWCFTAPLEGRKQHVADDLEACEFALWEFALDHGYLEPVF